MCVIDQITLYAKSRSSDGPLAPHPRAKALFHDVIVGRLALNAEGLPSPDPSASRLWPPRELV